MEDWNQEIALPCKCKENSWSLGSFWIIGRHDGMSSHFCHGSHIPHYSSPQKTRHGTFKEKSLQKYQSSIFFQRRKHPFKCGNHRVVQPLDGLLHETLNSAAPNHSWAHSNAGFHPPRPPGGPVSPLAGASPCRRKPWGFGAGLWSSERHGWGVSVISSCGWKIPIGKMVGLQIWLEMIWIGDDRCVFAGNRSRWSKICCCFVFCSIVQHACLWFELIGDEWWIFQNVKLEFRRQFLHR